EQQADAMEARNGHRPDLTGRLEDFRRDIEARDSFEKKNKRADEVEANRKKFEDLSYEQEQLEAKQKQLEVDRMIQDIGRESDNLGKNRFQIMREDAQELIKDVTTLDYVLSKVDRIEKDHDQRQAAGEHAQDLVQRLDRADALRRQVDPMADFSARMRDV